MQKKVQKSLTGRIRTIDLGITIVNFYSPPLYQLSYGELTSCRSMNPILIRSRVIFSLKNSLPCSSSSSVSFWRVRSRGNLATYLISMYIYSARQCVRVVKEPDLKSGGLCPRRFESCRWRHPYTCVDSSVVRIPAFQAGGPGSIPGRRIAPLV